MPKKLLEEDGTTQCEKTICPSPEELSVITNNVKCERCGLVFRNEPRYRLHDLKVHQNKKLDRITKENARYHCPMQSCVYALNSQRYFNTMKYLKQHYLKVHAEKSYRCDYCNDKSFSTASAKEAHMRICGTKFTCSCSKTYTTYEALLTHAKRSLHTITEKYKNYLRRTNCKTMKLVLSTGILSKPVTILPNSVKPAKSTCEQHVNSAPRSTTDIGVQTDDCRRNSKKPFRPLKANCNGKRSRISKQTQTNGSVKEKNKLDGKSMETQTLRVMVEDSSRARKCDGERSETDDVLCSKQTTKHTGLLHHAAEDSVGLGNNFASANLFPTSPLPLRHDVGSLQDLWEEKSTSGTQTLPEKDMFEAFNDNVTQTEFETLYEHSHNPLMQCVPKSTRALMTLPYTVTEDTSSAGYSFTSVTDVGMSRRADPILAAGKTATFDDRYSSIETQTEQIAEFPPSYFYPESLSRSFAVLSSNIETQTTDENHHLEDNMEELYSNTCTQTCNDEILSSDLGLADIQTQTAWSHDIAVSTETQTKSLICDDDCNDIPTDSCKSWMNTQTQTDLLSIFGEF